MTHAEFIQAEAEREGKQPHQLITEIYDDLCSEMERETQRLMTPEIALPILQQAAQYDYEAWQSDFDATQGTGKEEKFYWFRNDYRNYRNGVQYLTYPEDLRPAPPLIAKVIRVEDADSAWSFSRSRTLITALVECTDGMLRWISCSECYWAGSREEPPDYESSLSWIDLFSEGSGI